MEAGSWPDVVEALISFPNMEQMQFGGEFHSNSRLLCRKLFDALHSVGLLFLTNPIYFPFLFF